MTHFSDFGDPAWLTASDISFVLSHAEQIREVIVAFEGIGYVAGGAARYLLVPDAPEPLDIDVFLYCSGFDVDPLLRLGYEPVEDSAHRAPFFVSPGEGELRVQVVRPDHRARQAYGPPLEVLQSFTFTTEQAAVWYGAGGAAGLLSVAGRVDTENRALYNNRISNPILSLFRLNKYGQKGYSLSMETLIEITDVLRSYSESKYQAAVADARTMESTPPEDIPGGLVEGLDGKLPF